MDKRKSGEPHPELGDLIDDKRTSVSKENVTRIRPAPYRRTLDHLEQYFFWSSATRDLKPLWEHQTAAIRFAVAYSCADRRLPAEGNAPEAALIKMPTGTGKSGVIAIISRCLPDIRRVLVMTPRTALADQLRADIQWRFWKHLGLPAVRTTTFTATADQVGTALNDAAIIDLLPSRATTLLEAGKSTRRVVAIGTFQALEQLRREASQSTGTDSSDQSTKQQALELLADFDLVIVDEGHYEPAPKWSRAIREFSLPTLLLSATPYRNDYKAFRLRGNFVFNYSWEDALRDKSIRSVEFTCGQQSGIPLQKKNSLHRFVAVLKEVLPSILKRAKNYTPHPKVIVRAQEYESLNSLQSSIEAAFGQRPIVIHHQVKAADPVERRFSSVRQARAMNDSDQTTFWLHEWKLLEGVDDNSFVAVALYDCFTNARQLIQQVGRTVRTTDTRRRSRQYATVITLPEESQRLKSSWERYENFERYASTDPRHLVQAEAALPDALLSQIPKLQYLAGEFRPCFTSEGPQSAADFRVPASAAVFSVENTFDLTATSTLIEEAFIAEDRFKPLRLQGLPDNAMAYAYYGLKNSPYLSETFFPEWTLGVCVLVHIGSLVFVHDTGGIVFDANEFAMRRIDRSIMAKLMPQGSAAKPVRISRMSAISLDISERAIRSMAIRTRSLADTFGDLLDPILVPTTAFGFVDGRGRYLGLTRARVTDSYAEPLPLPDYCSWVEARATEIAERVRTHNTVFDRYAELHARLSEEDATPHSILLDVDETLTEFSPADSDSAPRLLQDVDYDDLCTDVVDGEFQVSFEGRSYDCEVRFKEESQRYSIQSPSLDSALSTRMTDQDQNTIPLTTYLNREQAFRIIVRKKGLIYAQRRFYRPRTEYVRPDGSIPLLERVSRVEALDGITTEKGENLYARQRANWRRQSIFGLIHEICQKNADQNDRAPLSDDLQSFDTIVCDDDGKEIADFLAISEREKRVALIHAKASNKPSFMSVRALQEVGRQALSSLAFCSAVAREAKITPGRWGTPVNANGIILNGLSRVFRRKPTATIADIEMLASRSLADRSWNREIWIVAANLMDRNEVEKAIRGVESNQARQYLMYLDSLITTCARANSTLRIYCN